jgi:hypothetical protein
LLLTDFSERGDKDPQRDDEGNLDAIELNVKHFVVVKLLMIVALGSVVGRMTFGPGVTVIGRSPVAFVGLGRPVSRGPAVERLDAVAFLDRSKGGMTGLGGCGGVD